MELVFDPAHLRVVALPNNPLTADLLYEPPFVGPPRPSGLTHCPFNPPPLRLFSDKAYLEQQLKELLLKPSIPDLPRVVPDVFTLLRTEQPPQAIELHAVRDLATGEIKGVREVTPRFKTTKVDFGEMFNKPPGFTHTVDLDKASSIEPGIPDKNVTITQTSEVNDMQNFLESLPDLEDLVAPELDTKYDAKKIDDVDDASLDESNTEQLEQIPQVNLTEVLQISDCAVTEKGLTGPRKWARVVDILESVPNYAELNPNPAFKWPFELDTFQKKAILLMEKGENVFVSAHTSAGKTVIAEYAISLAKKHMTKAIYTSPIKTLSNEKFRDFRETFDDVGIITGDVQIKRDAATLIMTTEILRSMLYNKAPVIDDLEWVIFDECHYINDADRGVVWEEVLIMLPSHVHIVLLSATVPNAIELADWIGRIKEKQIHVISTTKRPVPLEHLLYVGRIGASKEQKAALKTKATPEAVKLPDQAVLILDSSNQFKSNNYLQICAATKGSKSQRKSGDERSRYLALVQYLQKKDHCPAIIFTLSRKRCDNNAASLASMDMTTATEKSQIHQFIKQCTARLSSEDRRLPQVEMLKQLLEVGIGIHHSGILPIMKEVVEMLFQRGLTKLLFATETFAMGVNMPARTVVFDSIRKYDGYQTRDLLPAEYIQMAGRAGRRGKDSVGTVLIMVKGEMPDSSSLQVMMMGRPQLLQSKFKVTDTMILNLKAGLQRRVEDIMRDSFIEDSKQSQLDKLGRLRDELTAKLKVMESVNCDSCVDIAACIEDLECLRACKLALWSKVFEIAASSKVFAPGKVVVFAREGESTRLGVTTEFNAKQNQLSIVTLVQKREGRCYWPASRKIVTANSSKCELLSLGPQDILDLSTTDVRIDIRSLGTPRGRREAGQIIFEMAESWSYKKVNLAKEVKSVDLDLAEKLQNANRSEERVLSRSCTNCPLFESHSEVVQKRHALEKELRHVSLLLSEEGMTMMPDYYKHLAVLERLGYVEPNGPLKLKGRIARTMSDHEVVLTEILVGDILFKCKPNEVAALLSVFVYQGKAEDNENAEIPEPLEEIMEQFLALAMDVGKVRRECGFEEDPATFCEQFNRGLVNVIHYWASGMTFGQIMQLAVNQQEGTIVRCIQRLDELLGHVKDAAKIIGNPELHKKVEQASMLIRRDIVFAASLYLE
ncbi:helicase SKI2W-like [Tropilaelaps mercedesae]|uniref:Helicase SKI2W-like n=1 Tax=Tropilaelaps mercedesae TaxID=418985 RepID=A0A1V9XKW2_9ACAR|nr:helicase SKI2W-like [Tropilaelaps mercedesae]